MIRIGNVIYFFFTKIKTKAFFLRICGLVCKKLRAVKFFNKKFYVEEKLKYSSSKKGRFFPFFVVQNGLPGIGSSRSFSNTSVDPEYKKEKKTFLQRLRKIDYVLLLCTCFFFYCARLIFLGEVEILNDFSQVVFSVDFLKDLKALTIAFYTKLFHFLTSYQVKDVPGFYPKMLYFQIFVILPSLVIWGFLIFLYYVSNYFFRNNLFRDEIKLLENYIFCDFISLKKQFQSKKNLQCLKKIVSILFSISKKIWSLYCFIPVKILIVPNFENKRLSNFYQNVVIISLFLLLFFGVFKGKGWLVWWSCSSMVFILEVSVFLIAYENWTFFKKAADSFFTSTISFEEVVRFYCYNSGSSRAAMRGSAKIIGGGVSTLTFGTGVLIAEGAANREEAGMVVKSTEAGSAALLKSRGMEIDTPSNATKEVPITFPANEDEKRVFTEAYIHEKTKCESTASLNYHVVKQGRERLGVVSGVVKDAGAVISDMCAQGMDYKNHQIVTEEGGGKVVTESKTSWSLKPAEGKPKSSS